MRVSQAGWFLLARLGVTTLAGAIAGLLFGHVSAGVAAALALALAWQLYNLYRLQRWLQERASRDPPDAQGVWGEVVSQVVRLHRRKRFHKQRLLDVFRELRRSTAAMPDGVIVLNRDWEIAWFNRMAGRLLGFKRRKDIRMRVTNLVRDPLFVRYLESAEFIEPLIIARGSDSRTHLSFQVVPYGGDQHLMLVRDVSRQMALESMRKDFVANASHELRSPLTVITGYLETLHQDPMLDPGLGPPISEMLRQAERMNSIVRDLLELSSLDAIYEQANGEPIDVRAVASMLRKDVLAREQHPTVSVHIDSDAWLLGDKGEIYSAFFNLVENAAKYTPADRAMEMRWSVSDAGEGVFTVSDTGIGIAAEHLPRITERFYRVDAGRSRVTGGSGLGLAIVKHVLQHHGARLEMHSEEGVGSTFTCYFPSKRVLSPANGASIAAVASVGSAPH
jgi:two-component system, OmpR family, phosphate regulon sensor histidine kinase PhoR